MSVSETRNHIQIMIKMPNPSQEPPASSKDPNEELKDMDVLCTFKIKMESQNLDHGCISDHIYIYIQSGASSSLQSPKSGLKGHVCSLHLQNPDRDPKFRAWVNQRPVTTSKYGSRCQIPVRNLQHPPKPQMST